MTQNTLTNDIFNPAFPSELVWSGYVKPGAAAISITLPPGLYRLQGQAANASFIHSANNWNNMPLSGIATIPFITQETSIYISPPWRTLNLRSMSGVIGGTFTNFIYDGTNYATVGVMASAVSFSGNPVYTYSTDLITWSTRSIATTTAGVVSESYGDAAALIYDATGPSAKYFVNISSGTATNTLYYSTDSITWSPALIPGTVATGNSQILANPNATIRYVWTLNTGSSNTQCCSSTDGITWTSRTWPTTQAIVSATTNGTASTNQIYVAAIANSAQPIVTSTDGITWTQRSAGGLEGNSLSQVLWFNSKYWYIPVVNSARYATSTDGVTWTINTWPSRYIAINQLPIVANDKLFSSNSNNSSFISTDGITWTPAGNAANPSSFSYVNGKIIGTTSGGNMFVNDEGNYLRLYRMDNQVIAQ